MKRKIDEIDESLVSSLDAKLEGTLVVHTEEKAFLVFRHHSCKMNVFLGAGMRKRAHASI
jgi:hypothetical protein